MLINKNTIEQFKECDKTEILKSVAEEVVGNIKNHRVLDDPSLLNVFFVLSFAVSIFIY